MSNLYRAIIPALFIIYVTNVKAQVNNANIYQEKYRPQIHYSPQQHWMNDPNGMLFYKGTYHLFYQYYPDATVWGPMHWGHAESKDMIHWKELPVALYPDKLGYIFSGSAVADVHNTTGFGKNGQVPLVAMFTNHDAKLEKQGSNVFQNQSLAYSLDNGKSWTKYAGNPVLKNPGIKDFRDPKLMWYETAKKWILTLAVKDRVSFYSSLNLKNWKKESEFGSKLGVHGGVWECPDLFPLKLNGKTYWVLLVSINPGGPNNGSATQYFVGQFNGKSFVPADAKTRWIDYGPDDYAGVTWSNTGARKIFLGWMSNWLYANQVPTKSWRNAMTVPRELSLQQEKNEVLLASSPVKELTDLAGAKHELSNIKVDDQFDVTAKTGTLPAQYKLTLNGDDLKQYSVILSNDKGESVSISYDSKTDNYVIDRSKSGQLSFSKDFVLRSVAPRLTSAKKFDLTLVADAASVEVFADGGLSNLTATYFPTKPLNKISIQSPNGLLIRKLEVTTLKSIWQQLK